MGRLLSALGAQAHPGCGSRTGNSVAHWPIAPSPALPSALAKSASAPLALPSASTTSGATLSTSTWHGSLLLLVPESVASGMKAAAGHFVGVTSKLVLKVGLDDLLPISSHKGKYLDPVPDQRLAHGGRNRAAHEGVDAQVHQMHRSLKRRLSFDGFLGLGHNASALHLDDMNPLGGIEDRCDPVFQDYKSRLHL